MTSGQKDFYQNSDWAFAYSLCEDLSVYKSSGQYVGRGGRSAQMLQTIYAAMTNLLVTEADRRRVRIELEPPSPEETPAAVLAIADYREALDLAPEGDEQAE